MKKSLSLFLVLIMAFGIVSTGIAVPYAYAEDVQQTYTEGNFVYEIVAGNNNNYFIRILDYLDKESTDEIVIPETIGGYNVVYLAAESFKGCKCTSVSIPAKLTSVDPEAFAYDMPNIEKFTVDATNTRLSSDEMGILYKRNEHGGNMKDIVAYPKNAPHTSIEIAKTTRIIGAFAFADAKNLKTVNFANGSSLGTSYSIESYAFYNAKEIETLYIPRNLFSIGDYSFAGCSSLTSVYLPESINYGIGWDSFKDTPFINNPENYDEDGVLYLNRNLLATLPEADKSYYEIREDTGIIAAGAFQWDSLREVYLPSSIKYMEANPFAKCPNIEKFIIDPKSDYSTDEYGVLIDGKMAIAYPNGIYHTCYANVEIRSFANYAFYLSPIKNFYIGSVRNFEAIDRFSLGGEGVTDIYYYENAEEWEDCVTKKPSYDNRIAAQDVATIHLESSSDSEHQITVGTDMQAVCTCGYSAEFTPVNGNQTENGFVYHIVNGEAVIVSYLFKSSTDALVIPDTLGGYPVSEIDCNFAGCMFTSVHIPSTVTKIREGAFANALNVQVFTVAEGNEEFRAENGVLLNVTGYSIFAYPPSASSTEYIIPNKVVGIMPYAFCGTKYLKTVTMPAYNVYTVGVIYDYAFLDSSVENVYIEGKDFYYMSNGVFKNSQLKEINFSLDKVHLGENDAFSYKFGYDVFEGTPFLENAEYDEDGVFYHQNCLIATDKNIAKSNYDIKNGTTVVAGGAFRCSNLESVNIPASVKCIGISSFSNATALKAITVSDDNKYYCADDLGALYSKDKTLFVAYPAGREEVCYAVESGVTEISESAFNNVQFLECVNVPLSVATVGDFAFGRLGDKFISAIRYEGTQNDWEKISFSRHKTDLARSEAIARTYETYTGGIHTTTLRVTQPGCTSEGRNSYFCSCGFSCGYEIPRTGHNYSEYIYGNEVFNKEDIFYKYCLKCGTIVKADEIRIKLDNTELVLLEGAQAKLTATLKWDCYQYLNGDFTCDIVFESSNESVVTVNENGDVTALKAGTAVITAAISGTSIASECEVNVKADGYTVIWIVNGETELTTTVKAGEKIVAPEITAEEGYEFAGWLPEIPDVMPEEPLEFVAVLNKISKSENFDVSASYAPEAFDEEATLDVAEIQGDREPGGIYMVEGEYYEQVGLYNIKMLNRYSNVIQPNEGYTVTIRLALPEAYKNRTAFVIYHRFTGGGREQLSTEKGTVKVENGYLIFEVSSFSEFEVLAVTPQIKVTSLPRKTVYAYGEDIDLSGIILVYNDKNGNSNVVSNTSLLTVRGFDSTKTGKQTVTVSYGQYSDTFEVEVKLTFWQWILRIIFFGLIKF